MLKESLKKYFGFEDFRPGQETIIKSIMDNKNALVVMPTGAGKSLCYQLPSILSDSFSIIISPLISLMQDQVKAINKEKISAAFINSSLDYKGTQKVLNDIAQNKIKMIFIAPEKLNNAFFVEKLKQFKPSYLFVDEAHCISEWGHNFRPSYRNIKHFAKKIGIENISAFTATATTDVRNDIIQQLEFKNPDVFVTGFERNNISLNVEHVKHKKEKILEYIISNNVSTIVYTSTRKNAEELTAFLKLKNINVEYYHAGLTNQLRQVIQDDFIQDRLNVIVATNAFGMGIDKSNIGMVIHYNIPGSIENLYQEFGRAGRDGSESKSYLFYSAKDKYLQEFLINVNSPTITQIKSCYNAILDYHKIAVNSKSDGLLIIDNGLFKLLENNSVNQNIFHSAITNLELNGYLKLHNSSTQTSALKFLLTQEQFKSYIKIISNANMQNLLFALVKYYGNQAFEQETEININNLSRELDQSIGLIQNNLQRLADSGIINLELPNNFQKVEMLNERVDIKNLYLNYEEIEAKSKHSLNKLNRVIEYCFTDECRFKTVLNYFGENVNNYKCGKCDICTGASEKTNSTSEFVSEIVIRTLKEYKGGLSANKIIRILTGKTLSSVAKKLSTYQTCIHYKADEIENTISLLSAKNIIKKIGDEFFLNVIEELNYSESHNENSTSNTKTNYENNLELFNKLREERNIAAKKFSQHFEMICSDSILKIISKEKPLNPSDILNIKGFNQRMYNKVGLEFIEIIKEHNLDHETDNNKNDLPKHISQTYSLVKKDYSLEEISHLLKTPESIISLQLETIINFYPNEKFDRLISVDDYNLITSKLENKNDDIKEVKKKLPSNISYAKIRVAKSIFLAQPFSL